MSMDHRNGDVLPHQIMARREDWSDGISLYMRQVTIGQGSVVAKPVEFEPVLPNSYPRPMLSLGIQQAQQLMDELWQCGLRPSEGSGSAGMMAATQAHLKDLQRLVFKGKP